MNCKIQLNGLAAVAIAGVLLIACGGCAGRSPAADNPNGVEPERSAQVFGLGPSTNVTVIGDELTAGTADGGNGSFNWTAQLAKIMYDRRTPILLTKSDNRGSGYTHGGQGSPSIPEAARMKVDAEADVVIVFAGNNDSAAGVFEGAVDAYSSIRLQAPEASIVVVGPVWRDSNPPGDLVVVKNELRRAAEGSGAVFVDPIGEDWFGRIDETFFGATSPFDGGHAYIAGLIAPKVAMVADQLAGP